MFRPIGSLIGEPVVWAVAIGIFEAKEGILSYLKVTIHKRINKRKEALMARLQEATKNSFEGQDFFIGIDVHKKRWIVTIRTEGLNLKTYSMDPRPEILYHYMNRHYPGGRFHTVYEAGFCGFWIHRRLTEMGFRSMVVNPADIPTRQRERERKRDAVDSRKLARELEHGSLEPIFVPSLEQDAFRSVSRLYQEIVRGGVRIKQQIKAYLHYHGIVIPSVDEMSHWSGRFVHWLWEQEFSQGHHRYTWERMLERLTRNRKERLDILRQMRKMARGNQTIRYIRTVSGIGFITSFTYYAEVMDIRRFRNGDQFASYVGIAPSLSSSADTERVRGLTQRHNKYLRKLIIESAWVAIKKDPALTLAYVRYTKRMPKKKAIIRIARKLLDRIRYVWLNERPYTMMPIE